jgi:hypothetical protein
MRISTMMTAAAIVALAPVAAMAQDSVAYNAAPNDGWLYGSGNDYSPANSVVLTTDNSDQLYLRWHVTYEPSPASSNTGLYQFTSDQFDLSSDHSLSFDWGFDTSGTGAFTSASLRIADLGAHTNVSYNAIDPFNTGFNINDNFTGNGSTQNSERLSFPFIGSFDPNANDTYRVTLTVTGLDGGSRSLSAYAQVGTGAGAVPEPASWAMMLGGFGLVGGAMRRRKAAVRFA